MIKKLTYWKYRFDYIYAPYLNHKKPIDVMLELSSHCNMACSYCYHADQSTLPFNKSHMDYEVARKIIRESAEIGVKSLKFNYKGESTIHPRYGDLIRYARSLKRGSTFIDMLANSNFKFNSGNDSVFEGLASLTKVKVSYDSFDKNVFETQRCGGDHDLTTRNIDIFYNHSLRKKYDTKLVIQAVRSHHNKDEDIEGNVKRRWPTADVSIRDVVSGRVGGFKAINSRDFKNRKSCIQAHSRLIFRADGTVGLCCPDIEGKIEVGNIKENTVYELFNSDISKKIRRSLKDKTAFLNKPCKGCSSYESFKGYKAPWKS